MGVEAERPLERGNTFRFEPLVESSQSSPGDVAPPLALPQALPQANVPVEEVPVDMHAGGHCDGFIGFSEHSQS